MSVDVADGFNSFHDWPADMTISHALLARRLREAYVRGAVPPLRDGLEPLDVEGAYAVQTLNTAHWLREGRRIVGRKIGLTAQAVQKQLGVDQPDYGVLFDDMEIADGGILDPKRTLQPKVEGEIALVLACDLDAPEATAQDILAATASAHTAIEIVDSRIVDWKITLADTVADNASAGFFVRSRTPHRLNGIDLAACAMVLDINGAPASRGVGANCLGNPLNAAAWLARTMARLGEPLRAGDVLLTGALGPMVALNPGDAVRVTINGLGSCSFVYGQA